MGILLRQEDNRSQYQERIAAELRERAKQQLPGSEPLDQTKNSNYIKNTSGTSEHLWVWVVGIGAAAAAVAIFIFTRS
jgi:type VI protein secretion system component VasF